MKKRIAVVVPNWNGQDFLDQCLEGLKNQTIEHTVFVVDNGSLDNSKEIIENSQAIGIYLDKNYGFAGGVNRGIERAIGDGFEYVMLHNNDAKPAPGALEILLKTAEADDRIGIATCKLLTYNGKKLDSTGDFYSTWGLPYPRGRGSTDVDAYDSLTNVFGGTGGASLYRVAMFKDIGLFDEDFFAYFEDVDLSFRAQLRNWKAVYAPKAKIYHHIGGTSRKLKGFSTYQSFKNLPWLLVKNVPDELFWKIGFRFLLTRLFFFASSIFRGELGYAIKGDWASTKGLAKKWRERKEIQANATASAGEILDKLYGGIPPNYLRLRSIRDKFKGAKPESEPHSKPVIAIDLRCLDGFSRFRGIGQYLHNLLSLLIPELAKKYTIIVYIYNPDNLGGIDSSALKYCEIITANRSLTSKLPTKLFKKFKGNFFPRSFQADGLPRVNEVDLFLQTYINDGMPTKYNAKTLSIVYDLIPLIYSSYYFGRIGLGRGPKGQLARISRALDKKYYVKDLQGYGKSTRVVAISKHTKKTLVEELGVSEDKVDVSYPGVPPNNRAEKDSFSPPDEPYIVYVGGIDYRRDLVALIESFEILRAKEKYKLVLAGRDFDDIHDRRLAEKLKVAKYKDDIIIHGYISDYAKHVLMSNAVAMVYPTLYEGFGIPVVEAFQDSCPVITYKNSSVVEAGGDAAIYAETPELIAKAVHKLRHDKKYRKTVVDAGLKHYKQFTWEQASKDYLDIINGMLKND